MNKMWPKMNFPLRGEWGVPSFTSTHDFLEEVARRIFVRATACAALLKTPSRTVILSGREEFDFDSPYPSPRNLHLCL